MFKYALSIILITVPMVGQAPALPIEIEILSKQAVAQLSDALLVETYIDVLVEVETAKTFHGRAGFQLKEIKDFKKLLRYRYDLIIEMRKRKMEVLQVGEATISSTGGDQIFVSKDKEENEYNNE